MIQTLRLKFQKSKNKKEGQAIEAWAQKEESLASKLSSIKVK